MPVVRIKQLTVHPTSMVYKKIFKCNTDLFHILVHNRQNCPNNKYYSEIIIFTRA